MSVSAIGGTVFIKVDGAQYQLRGNLKCDLAAFERKGIAGADGVHGSQRTPKVPYISGDFSDSADLDVEALNNINGATITVELDNGKVGLLESAFYSGPSEVDGVDGKVGFKFEGLAGKWLK